MQFPNLRPATGALLADRRRWLVVAAVLLSTHACTAWYYAARYVHRQFIINGTAMTLDMTPTEWARHLGNMDAAAYLKVAENFSAGRGVTIPVIENGSRCDKTFFYWGPGAPVVFGTWMKLFGRYTMWPIFWFAVAAQLLFGVVSVAMASLWTRKPLALAIVAVCSGFCPPLQQWFYGIGLTSSEIVALVPLSVGMFLLANGLRMLRRANDKSWRNGLNWRVAAWFAGAGTVIGLFSLIRDAGVVLATFTAIFVFGRALLMDRPRLTGAAVAGGLLIACTLAVRFPVECWNKHRIGAKVVSTSSAGAVWRYGLWLPENACAWYPDCGIGFGHYLDPDAAKRVEQYFADNRPHPQLYSFGQLLQAIWKRPVDAFVYRIVRAPLLWLDIYDGFSVQECGPIADWCMAFYAMFAGFCVVQYRKRREIPEVTYLFGLLLVCAFPFIHCEFRYSFPVWNTLILVPGLLVATLTRNGWLSAQSVPSASRSKQPILPESLDRPQAA